MPRDRQIEREVRLRTPEETVVEYLDGVFAPPASVKALVDEYNKRRAIVDICESYPRKLDDEMNKLFDAMLVMV